MPKKSSHVPRITAAIFTAAVVLGLLAIFFVNREVQESQVEPDEISESGLEVEPAISAGDADTALTTDAEELVDDQSDSSEAAPSVASQRIDDEETADAQSLVESDSVDSIERTAESFASAPSLDESGSQGEEVATGISKPESMDRPPEPIVSIVAEPRVGESENVGDLAISVDSEDPLAEGLAAALVDPPGLSEEEAPAEAAEAVKPAPPVAEDPLAEGLSAALVDPPGLSEEDPPVEAAAAVKPAPP
ncbi:MAG: hypothetical protein OXN84_18640, partial [Albidovulum sp.]|nr:hypothetical protein [Albidovulum sp.]